MGRSQVLRNRLSGRGRGKGRTGKNRNEKDDRGASATQQNFITPSHLDRAGDNSWRYNSNDNMENSDEFLKNQDKQIDVTTSYLLSQYDHAISSSYYQSSNPNRSNQFFDDEFDTNNINTHSHHYQEYMSNFQSPSFNEAMNSLPPSTRLRLSSEIADLWDDFSLKGYSSTHKKTLAEIRMNDLKIQQSFQNEITDKSTGDSKENETRSSTLPSEKKIIKEKEKNNNKHEPNHIKQKNEGDEENSEKNSEENSEKNSEENSEENSVHDQHSEEIEDLDSWLDDAIKVHPQTETDKKEESTQKQKDADKKDDIKEDELDEEEDLDAWLDSVIA